MSQNPKSIETENGSSNIKFTVRQMEVLKLMAVGFSNREMAERLKVCEKTIEKHRTIVYEKIGAGQIVMVVHYAIRFKLVPLMEFREL